MPSEMEFVNFKDFVESLPEAGESALNQSNGVIINDASAGPKKLSADKVPAKNYVEHKKANLSELAIVSDGLDITFTQETSAGVDWVGAVEIAVLPGQKVTMKATADESVQQASGTAKAIFDDGSEAQIGSSWPNYNFSYTNETGKTVSKIIYGMSGNRITSSGVMSFNAKVDPLTANLAPKSQVEEIKDGVVDGSVLVFHGTEISGWSFNSNEYLKKDGTAISSTGYVSSDFIPVFGSAKYTLAAGGSMFNTNQPIVFYNYSRAVVGYYDTNTTDASRTFTTPDGTSYIRYSCFGSGSGAKLTYVGEEVKSISDEVNAIKNDLALLPIAKVYGVVGLPIYVWFDALFRINPKNAVCHKVSGSGTMEKRNCIFYDLENAYSGTTILKWYSTVGEIKIEQRISFKIVAANAKSGTSAKVLMIGDSLTAYGKITNFLDQIFQNDVMNVTLLGTKGSATNKYEGRAGWSSYDYTHTESYNGSTNPFLNNGVFDFGYYLTQNSVDTPDIVVIELGTNDYWRPNNGTTTHENIEEIITSIKSTNANVKIIVLTADCPYLGEDATLAENYYPRNQLWEVSKGIVDHFANRESENIFCVPMGGIFHPVESFDVIEVPVCPHSAITTTRCTDTIHPNDVGFRQIADELYCAIKGI